jgi:RNA polymerase sigma-70 factor (ECF subfamily)
MASADGRSGSAAWEEVTVLERDLVERARAGDGSAYEQLARAVVDPLYRVAHRILRDSDAADDAVQQALVAIWRDLPKLRDPDRFRAWSYRLVVRAAYAEAGRHRRQARVTAILADEPSVSDTSFQVAARDALDRAFDALSVEHRAVLVLHYHLGMTIGEIATTLDVPYGTVGSRLHYAIRSLRVAFGTDGKPRAPAAGPPRQGPLVSREGSA